MSTPPPAPTDTAAPDGPMSVSYIPAPAGTPAETPRVFAAIAAVMRDAMPVGKNQRNQQQNYNFRGIDDVMSAMAGPMRAHGLFILPSVTDRKQERRGEKMTHVVITMRYRIYGPAGDCLVADVPGEASDFADKSTNKAQSAALKYLLFTLFMLPVDGRSIDDGDRDASGGMPEPRAEQAPRQQQAPPVRDYLAEARKSSTPEAFAKVRADAVAAGAPADYLAQLDAVAARKQQAATQQTAPAAPDQERAAAVADMYAAGRNAGCNREEVDALLHSKFGTTPDTATPDQITALIGDLVDAARGAAA
ncbi:ERF family protein [Streptomyces sp. NPDC058254]|uniref:ERF family protein n=1 Tax=Streptomyces sp. NPDC058254 TaxID=3346406 RepID=UPI0036E40638